MTEREKLIEVIRNALWRQTFAPDEDVIVIERQKANWPDDWDRTLAKAKGILLALEAAGVRLVPVEATSEMIQMAESLHTIDELTTDEYRRAYKAMIAFSPYAPEGT